MKTTELDNKDFPPGALVAVLTGEPLGTAFDYLVPDGGCQLGDFVLVPLGKRRVIGVVWDKGQGGYDLSKTKEIEAVLDVPPLHAEMRNFLIEAAAYTLTPLTAMLRLATRVPGLADPPGMRKLYQRGEAEPSRMTDARLRVLDAIEEATHPLSIGELSARAGASHSVIHGLAAQSVLIELETPRDRDFAPFDLSRPARVLNAEQARAAEVIAEGIAQNRYATTLLRGVTGSGKTEVYLDAVARTLRSGRQALVLLPEIALTTTFFERIKDRFGAPPAQWHSGVPASERRRVWRKAAEGNAKLVIGARSALFLPFQNLGLIVVDEEHDSSYKQEEGALYNARDMAVLRASILGAQVVLASATPSLESWVNAKSGKYKRVDLKSRFGPAVLPQMRVIDMRMQKLPADRWISQPLQEAVNASLMRQEQALLFINRRGFAPVTLCRACGHQIGCDHCDARMVEHRFQKRLVCHQCGHSKAVPTSCPHCKVEGKLAPIGPGIERLHEEAAALFPQARIAVLSSDLYSSARALKDEIEKISDGGADLVIGTQLVAKGHNFPKLSLVGVIDADLGLQGSDLRAAERTFQLMRQVAGRAGRAQTEGLALLQSYQPEHPVIQAIMSGEEEGFWNAEAREREALGMPPYGRLAGIVVSGTDMKAVFEVAKELSRKSKPLTDAGATLYGPAPAPIARIRGRHRVRFLVKAPKTVPLQTALRAWSNQFKRKGDLRLTIDIDPHSFL